MNQPLHQFYQQRARANGQAHRGVVIPICSRTKAGKSERFARSRPFYSQAGLPKIAIGLSPAAMMRRLVQLNAEALFKR